MRFLLGRSARAPTMTGVKLNTNLLDKGVRRAKFVNIMSVVPLSLASHDVGLWNIFSFKLVDSFMKLTNLIIVALRLKLLYLFIYVIAKNLKSNGLLHRYGIEHDSLDILTFGSTQSTSILILVFGLALLLHELSRQACIHTMTFSSTCAFTSITIPTTGIEGSRRIRCAGGASGLASPGHVHYL